jgi:alpha-L-fucosidase 2
VTAGIAEAFLQSRERTIYLLPCLPKAWQTGSFSGFRARGGVTIDASWKPESLTATFTANRDGSFEVRHENEVRKMELKAGTPVTMEFKRKGPK